MIRTTNHNAEIEKKTFLMTKELILVIMGSDNKNNASGGIKFWTIENICLNDVVL